MEHDPRARETLARAYAEGGEPGPSQLNLASNTVRHLAEAGYVVVDAAEHERLREQYGETLTRARLEAGAAFAGQLDAQIAARDEARVEAERLRKALEPFAAVTYVVRSMLADCERARAMLGEQDPTEGGEDAHAEIEHRRATSFADPYPYTEDGERRQRESASDRSTAAKTCFLPMTPEDRAREMVLDARAPYGAPAAETVIASAIEECRLHAGPGTTSYCDMCDQVGPCDGWKRLSPPLLADGVPEQELRKELLGTEDDDDE